MTMSRSVAKRSSADKRFKELSKYVTQIVERELLNGKYLSIEDFSKELNVSRSVMLKWLSGNHDFNMIELARIEIACGIKFRVSVAPKRKTKRKPEK